MKLPDPQARTQILTDHLQSLPKELRDVDVPRLIAATEGFTGADLKRTVEDGKAIYAYDKSKGVERRPTTEYFMRAVEAVRENKERYAEAEAQAALRPKNSMSGFMSSFISSGITRGDDEE
jgi:ATP-dependent 26S proteasome regulatory subunit